MPYAYSIFIPLLCLVHHIVYVSSDIFCNIDRTSLSFYCVSPRSRDLKCSCTMSVIDKQTCHCLVLSTSTVVDHPFRISPIETYQKSDRDGILPKVTFEFMEQIVGCATKWLRGQKVAFKIDLQGDNCSEFNNGRSMNHSSDSLIFTISHVYSKFNVDSLEIEEKYCESKCGKGRIYNTVLKRCYCIIDNKQPKLMGELNQPFSDEFYKCRSMGTKLAIILDSEDEFFLSSKLFEEFEDTNISILLGGTLKNGELTYPEWDSAIGKTLFPGCQGKDTAFLHFSMKNRYNEPICRKQVELMKFPPEKFLCQVYRDSEPPSSTADPSTTIGNSSTTVKPSTVAPVCSCMKTAYEIKWCASREETVENPCPHGLFGTMSWTCGKDNEFITEYPDTSKCVTSIDPGTPSKVIDDINQTLHEKPPQNPEDNLLWLSMLQTTNEAFLTQLQSTGQLTEEGVAHTETYLDDLVSCNEVLMLDSVQTINMMEEEKQLNMTSSLVFMISQTSFAVADKHLQFNNTYRYMTKTSDIVADIAVANVSESDHYSVNYNSGHMVTIPLTELPTQGSLLKVVSTFMRSKNHTCDKLWPGHRNNDNHSGLMVNSDIITVMINDPGKTSDLQIPVTVIMEEETESRYPNYGDIKVLPLTDGDAHSFVRGTSRPMARDTKENKWTSEGCYKWNKKDKQIKFKCFRTGSFSILTDTHNREGGDPAEMIMTMLSLSVANLCLVLTLAAYFITKKKGLKTTIVKNLSFMLLFSNIIVLFFVKRMYFTFTKGVCKATGIALHFTLLAAFCWMGVGGYYVNSIVTQILPTIDGESVPPYLFGYGVPFIIVAITVIVSEAQFVDAYLHSEYCWLSADRYIWAFSGPSLFIVMFNMYSNARALYAASDLVINKGKTFYQRARTLMTGFMSLNGITGATWIIGYLYLQKVPFLSYIFILINGSQGIVLFLFHVIFNEAIWLDVKKYFGRFRKITPKSRDTLRTTVTASRRIFQSPDTSETSFNT